MLHQIFIRLRLFSYLISAGVLRVTAKDCGAGFFALMVYAVNQLIWADHHGYAAYVDFGQRCRNGRLNRYYDAM